MAKEAEQQLRKDILPLEQRPEITEVIANGLQGMNVYFYGESAPLGAVLTLPGRSGENPCPPTW